MKRYRNSDRFIHDVMSSAIAGKQNAHKDAAIDIGVIEHGSQHRKKFPHRSVPEATMYLTLRDVVNGRKPDIVQNFCLCIGHMAVDKIDSKTKQKLSAFATLVEVLK